MARTNSDDLLMEDDLAAAFLGGEELLKFQRRRGRNDILNLELDYLEDQFVDRRQRLAEKIWEF